MLGAPLEAGKYLYPELQETYIHAPLTSLQTVPAPPNIPLHTQLASMQTVPAPPNILQ